MINSQQSFHVFHLTLFQKPLTHLLLGLQTLWIYSSHVVGFCADIIVSLVLDKVHTGVICGLCSHVQMWGNMWNTAHQLWLSCKSETQYNTCSQGHEKKHLYPYIQYCIFTDIVIYSFSLTKCLIFTLPLVIWHCCLFTYVNPQMNWTFGTVGAT